MPVDFGKLSPKASFRRPDEEHEEGFIFSQSQHVVSDTDDYYVTMTLNRNFVTMVYTKRAIVPSSIRNLNLKLIYVQVCASVEIMNCWWQIAVVVKL